MARAELIEALAEVDIDVAACNAKTPLVAHHLAHNGMASAADQRSA
jgi:hypothetical protein